MHNLNLVNIAKNKAEMHYNKPVFNRWTRHWEYPDSSEHAGKAARIAVLKSEYERRKKAIIERYLAAMLFLKEQHGTPDRV